MEKQISIHIPEPCHEQWNEMMPKDKGRFCNSCTKVVVDFTLMTNGEIIRFFEDAYQSKVCGRFNSFQLNKPLDVEVKQTKQHSFYEYVRGMAALLITGITLLLSSCNRKPATLGKPAVGIIAVDSNYSKIVIPKDTIVPVQKHPHSKMGKVKVAMPIKEISMGEPAIMMGGARPYIKEEEILIGDTIIIKK